MSYLIRRNARPFHPATVFSDGFYNDFFSPHRHSAVRGCGAGHLTAVDIHETEDAWRVEMDLPGVYKDDVSISLEKGVLTISGERKGSEDGEDTRRRGERYFGEFSRSFTIGEGVDSENISAKMDHGVLSLTLPKSEQAVPRTIPVNG